MPCFATVSRGSLGALSPAQLKKSKNGAAPRWAAAAAPKPAGPPMNHPGVAAGALLPPPGLILDPPTANHGITACSFGPTGAFIGALSSACAFPSLARKSYQSLISVRNLQHTY